MPVYDIYPLSYLRLLGMILMVILLHLLAARKDDDPPEFLERLNNAFGLLSWHHVTESTSEART